MASYNVYQPVAQGFTPRQTRGAFNNQLAQAHAEADPRYNTKPMDRAGLSRGAGVGAMAGIASAQNLADGIARAYSGQLQDATANANVALGNRQAAEGLGQDMNALAMQSQYADLLARLQRQGDITGFQSGVLGGLMGGGLDSFLGF